MDQQITYFDEIRCVFLIRIKKGPSVIVVYITFCILVYVLSDVKNIALNLWILDEKMQAADDVLNFLPETIRCSSCVKTYFFLEIIMVKKKSWKSKKKIIILSSIRILTRKIVLRCFFIIEWNNTTFWVKISIIEIWKK